MDGIPINSTMSTKHPLFVDGIPINSTVSTKHPLFVDDIPINATVSTKYPLFVDTVPWLYPEYFAEGRMCVDYRAEILNGGLPAY